MIAPVGQAIDALSAGISGLLSAPGPGSAPEVFVVSSKTGLAGIGGFVGLHDDPVAEIFARRLEAEVTVRVFANNAAALNDAEVQATRDVIGADSTQLRQLGILRINRDPARTGPMLLASDGIPAPAGRDLTFIVQFEHKPLPDSAEGILNEAPVDLTTAELSGRGALVYENNFDEDPLGDFTVHDRSGGTGTAGAWSFDAVNQEIIQTGTASGGSNGVSATKQGTYLVTGSGVTPLADFTLNTEMRAGTPAGIGIVFRFQDIDNFGWAILEEPAGVRLMGKRIAATGSFLDFGAQDATQGFPADTWMRLRFLASGDRFELAINETIVLSGRDTGLNQPGAVGLFCRRANSARFRHFRLSSL